MSPCARTTRSSGPASASTRRASASTSSTAGSCGTCSGDCCAKAHSSSELRGSAFRGVDEASEARGYLADRFLVTLFRETQPIAVLAVGLDHPVDELTRLPVRIRRLRHRAQCRSLHSRSTISSANHVYQQFRPSFLWPTHLP